MKRPLFTFFLFTFFSFCFVHPIQASLEEFNMKVTPSDIVAAPDARVYGSVVLENTSNSSREITLSLSDLEEISEQNVVSAPFDSVRFFGAVPEAFEDQLAQGDVSSVCRSRDASEALDTWCDGKKEISITLAKESSVTVPFVFISKKNVQDRADAFIVARSDTSAEEDDNKDRSGAPENVDESLFHTQKVTYISPVDSIVLVEISSMTVSRSFGPFDFFSWMRSGFRETYDSEVVIVNRGTEDVIFTLNLVVDRAGEEEILEREIVLKKHEEITENFSGVAVERLGTTFVRASLEYNGSDGPYVVETDRARIAVTPLKEIMSGIIFSFGLFGLYVWWRNWRAPRVAAYSYADAREKTPVRNMSDPDDRLIEQQPTKDDDDHQSTPSRVAKKVRSARKTTKKRAEKIATANADLSTDSKLARPVLSEKKPSQMDLEWMWDDEKVFDEAMRAQERTANVRVGLFAFISLCALLFLAFFIIGRLFFSEEETRSISDLHESSSDRSEDDVQESDSDQLDIVEDNEKAQDDLQVTPKQDEKTDNESVAQKKQKEETKKEDENVNENVSQSDKVPAQTTVRVLNGGEVAGAAGALSEEIAKKGYKVLSASNASNNYQKTTVYHAKGQSAQAKALLKSLGVAYNTSFVEDSDAILKKHAADLVVVIGKTN